MERRPSNSIRLSTVAMPRRRQWRDMPTTVHPAIDNQPRPVNPSQTISPVVTVPAVAQPPSALVPQTQEISVSTIFSGLLSDETKRAYRGDFKHYLAFLGHADLLDKPREQIAVLTNVTRDQASAYRDHMLNTEQLSAATVCRHLTTINVVYEALREEGLVSKNPFSWVKRPKIGNVGKTPAFTKEQAECILSQPDTSTAMGKRDKIILSLLYFCGLRRSEVAKVEKNDFYESQGHIMLRVHSKGKSDKTDFVMIPPRIWPEIRAYLENIEGFLFTAQSRNKQYNRNDKPLSPTRIYMLFKKYCRMAGIDADAYSPHSTRATFITLCLAGGADIRSVMYACRHSDPATTIRYDRQRLDLENHASNYLSIDL